MKVIQPHPVWKSRLPAWSAALCVSWVALLIAGCQKSPGENNLGKVVARQTGPLDAAGQASLDFAVEAGRHYWIAVEQHDFDAKLLLQESAQKLTSAMSPTRAAGQEYLLWRAERSASLKLVVSSVTPAAPSARYAAEVLRVDSRISAQALAALQLLAAPATGAQLEQAARYWESENHAQLVAAFLLKRAAQAYWEESDWLSAVRNAERAIGQYGEQRNVVGQADALMLAAAARIELAQSGVDPTENYTRSDTMLTQARAIFQRAGQPVNAAQVLMYLGASEHYRNQYPRAVAIYEEGRLEFAAAGARHEQLLALSNVAAVRLSRGEYREASDSIELALPLLSNADAQQRSTALQNSATALQLIGRTELALDRYLESLRLAQSLRDDSLATRALTGLGIAHQRLGQFALARDYLTQATALIEQTNDRDRLAIVQSSLADVYSRLGDRGLAQKTHRTALSNLTANAAPLRRARLTVALANELAAQGGWAEAERLYASVLELQALAQEVTILQARIGRAQLLRRRGRFAAAATEIAVAVATARATGDRENLVRALAEQARIAQQRGANNTALTASQEALNELDALAALVTNSDNRITLAAQLRDVVDLNVDLLGNAAQREYAGNAQAAGAALALASLAAAERGQRGVGFAMTASGPAADARAGALYDLLAGKRQRLRDLGERDATPSVEMRSLQLEVVQLQTRLAARANAAPQISAMPLQPASESFTAASLVELEGQIPSDTLVLAYWLGASQSWLWALSNDGLQLYRLPPRERIAKSAAELLRAITNLQDAAQIEGATAALRGALLPAAVQRAAQRRWLVLPDGVTAAVPWALLEKAPNRDVQELASLAALRKDPAARILTAESQPLRRIALFGDPIFEANDARIGGSRTAAGQAVTMRAALSLTTLPRLPGTARELVAIASLDPAGAILQRTGADANRSTVLTQSRSNADILHLATHAVLDNEIPALAAIVLSRFDASGRPQPADLRPRDILQMREPPRLVVLSACDTASNPVTHAPGLLSLSRAFLTAGSEHVVASLWPVSDAGAVAFMTEFYRALLRDRLSPAAALRHARATMAQSPQFSAPFFWAGFVIVSRQP